MKKNHSLISNIIIVITLFSLSVITLGTLNTEAAATNADKPIYKNPSQNAICFTFNVYQGNEYLQTILNVLKEKDCKATFFLGGCWARKNPELVKEIAESGFEIGSHGYFHRDHDKMNYNDNYTEIKMSVELLESITGQKIKLFAPPSGAYNDNTMRAAKDMELEVIMWSKDTIDWRDQDTELIVRRATNEIRGGDIILMHPTECTAKAIAEIADKCIELGLRPETVGNTLN